MVQGINKVDIKKEDIKQYRTYYAVVTSERNEWVSLLLEQHKSTIAVRDGIPIDIELNQDSSKGKFLMYNL
jgi:hypothetical protein